MHTPSIIARRLATAALVATVALAAACVFGPTLATYAPASEPAGTSIRLRGSGFDIRGELLALRGDTVVVREGSRVVAVAVARASYVRVEGVGELHHSRDFRGRYRERARLLSRFPQGLTAEIERTLLATLGRDAVEVVR